ncbi:MAG: hypothetical protein WA210_19235 [Burkholderiaceae bacterium]
MASYLQLGHESWSLLEESDGGSFTGLVLSPVNDDPSYVTNRLAKLGKARAQLEVILDPQLYNPAADRGQLGQWPYYTSEFETANHHDEAWWVARGEHVASVAAELEVDAICSPAMYPRKFDDDYYRFVVDVGDETYRRASRLGVETLLTAIVPLQELANPRRALDIASILTETDCERVYLTIVSDDVQQRAPMIDASGLATAIHMIRLLSASQRVHVAFCAHDVVLWKAAGATDVSTGKWMNVRRFSPGRWREEDSMGRQVPYWNEPQLYALLRDQDVMRLDREKWFDGRDFTKNPSGERILSILRSGSGAAWQKLSWLQYLRWFTNHEPKFEDPTVAERALAQSDRKWSELDKMRIQMTDRFNDGTHVRLWLNALREGLGRS